jgi:hypothetical protein
MGAAAIGGGAGFLVSDFFGETIKAAANLTGKTAVTVEVVAKGGVGLGLLGLGWKIAAHPLARIGFFASGIGAFASGVVDVVKYFVPIEEWGKTAGEKIRGFLKLGAGAVEGANQMSRDEYEKVLAAQKRAGSPGKGTVLKL